jgi:D-alanine-D-alanine ligase
VAEMLNLCVTHSDAVSLGVTLDKMLARRVVTPDVPVAPAMFIDIVDPVPSVYPLVFPVVVKPNDEGSSKGIRDDSIASDVNEADHLVRRLRRTYGCPILVEQYLPGKEITVGLIGNGATSEILGLMEIEPVDATSHFLYSVEAKRAFRERVRYHVPPRLPCATLRDIERYARTAFRLLGCRDVARCDFRLDAAGVPHFLECNPLPGLNPDCSDLVIMTRHKLSHRELVHAIFEAALQRYGMTHA